MNPFTPWLPMYGGGVHPERPWWRRAVMDSARDPAAVYWVRLWDSRGPLLERDLAEIDAAYPVAPPPPMEGQVWVQPNGVSRQVLGVDTPPCFYRVEWPRRTVVYEEWPEKGDVLVAGPTPWGRDVPWAPAGWKS